MGRNDHNDVQETKNQDTLFPDVHFVNYVNFQYNLLLETVGTENIGL